MKFRPSSGRYQGQGTLLSLFFSILCEYGAVKAKTCKHSEVSHLTLVQQACSLLTLQMLYNVLSRGAVQGHTTSCQSSNHQRKSQMS